MATSFCLPSIFHLGNLYTTIIMNIDNMNKADLELLQSQINKRVGELQKRENNVPVPIEFEEINWVGVYSTAKGIVDQIKENGFSGDSEHWCYEEVMEAVFGDNIWEWLNEHDEGC